MQGRMKLPGCFPGEERKRDCAAGVAGDCSAGKELIGYAQTRRWYDCVSGPSA